MFINRIEKILKQLKEISVDGILVTDPKNIYYVLGISGFSDSERESMVLILNRQIHLFIPRMYKEVFDQYSGDIKDKINLVVLKERTGFIENIKEIINEKDILAFEEYNLSVLEFNRINEGLGVELKESENLLKKIRSIKEIDEIELMSKAVKITDKVLENAVDKLKTIKKNNITEFEFEYMLREEMKKMGGEGFGFNPIIASGAGSSQPHYKTSNKTINIDKPLLIDIGVKYMGYSGDLTRTFWVGDEVDSEFKIMYEKVLECNNLCIEQCKEGIDLNDLHNIAVDYFKKEGLEEFFIHSIGHSIGLDIHERILPDSEGKQILKENMIITIEPGLYFPGKFGIRIEDYVRVTKNGCEVLNSPQFRELTAL